jgi:hypothetical protein
MFQTGDLLWIPSQTVLMIPRPNNPAAIRITQEPEVGIFVSEEERDRDFIKFISDGREWVANRKHIKHLRREYASKVS